MPDFHGVLPALITPFTEDGTDVDADALAAIVNRLAGAGAGGLVPGGSTGEFTTLTNEERRRVIEVTVEVAAGRVPVVAGTGALSTQETVALSVHAERAGATAVMVVPPFYDALSWRELLAHYAAVAEAISLPIMYYNLPSASGVKLDTEQLRELRRVARVTSLKDTGGDAVAATELIQAADDGPTLLNGWDTLTFAALAAGVRAVVWGTASILPEQCVALHRLLIDEIDLPAARELWTRLWPLCHFLENQSYSAAVKTACALVGDSTGPVRAPLLALDDDAVAELEGLLERARRASRWPCRSGDQGRPAPGTSTVVVSRTASRAAFRGPSWKSGAPHAISVRPSSPPSPHAKTPRPSGIATSSTISPPGATRQSTPPSALAAQMCSSASSAQPSGAKVTAPSIVSVSAGSGVGSTWAQTRRSVSAPSGAIVNAVKRAPKVSATISVPSSVMTVPLGNQRSSAAMLALPSGSIRTMAAVAGSPPPMRSNPKLPA